MKTSFKGRSEDFSRDGSIGMGRRMRLPLALLLAASLLGGPFFSAAEDEFARHLRAGSEETSQGNFSAAMAELEAAVALDPGSAAAWYQFGLLLGQIADFRGAEAAFRRAIKLKPDLAKAHYNLALTLVADSQSRLDWPGAIAELREALQYQPNYAEALNLLGAGLTSTGKVDAAIPELERAIQLSPSLAEAHFNLAIAFEQKDLLDKAIKEYRLATAAKGEYPEVSSALGKLLFRMGRPGEAELELIAALRQNPDLADAHYVRSKVLRSLNRNNEAAIELDEFKDLSQRGPNATESSRLSNLGLEAAAKGDLAGAAASLRKAIALKPDYGVPHYNLGLILADTGDMAGAAQELAKAISLLPGQARPWFDLGRVLRRVGDNQAALAAVSWAAHLSPSDPAILSELASLRDAVHSADEAAAASSPLLLAPPPILRPATLHLRES
jgi:tetratricopeptide (TPR) repeat protein